jgi:hypothetical protein
MRLTGFEAISYAEREGLTLNKAEDVLDEARTGLTVAEAEAIESASPGIIWLEVPDKEYSSEPRNLEPQR